MKDNIIAREGWSLVSILSLLTITLYLIDQYWLAFIGLILSIFTIFFFRNPYRYIKDTGNVIVAPADGKILEIKQVYEGSYLKEEAIQVRIFLSLFDVHINRIPFSGIVEYVEKSGMKFYPAYKPIASSLNVKNKLGIKTEYGKILVIQITGIIARRIVCYSKVGDIVNTGERFGLIKFGSCTELYLPKCVNIEVFPGDKIKGGETVIGKFT